MYSLVGEPTAAPSTYSATTFTPEKIYRVVVAPATFFTQYHLLV